MSPTPRTAAVDTGGHLCNGTPPRNYGTAARQCRNAPIGLDFRYGWDGIADGTSDLPPNPTWFAEGRLSRHTDPRTAFCRGLTARGFSTGCAS
ncbi:hypothetical protein ACIBBD_03790 [Streptomyces sp. NPDC051315]|uniref:hypothetical protein n=1 Tax=Streptomyces sp. NPDC051315 TaxID=3365650 RepID=UPI0037B06A85